MARLIFINRYFFPDQSATSQLVSDLAFYLAAKGYEVRVLTSRQLYGEPTAALPEHETIRNVQVRRLVSTQFGRNNLSGRAIDYWSFYRSVRRQLGAILQPNDIVIAMTDPPLLTVAVESVVRRRNARLVNWLQDVYPETAIVLGVPLMRSPLGMALRAIRNRNLRLADTNVVVGGLMARCIEAPSIAASRVNVITNWCDDEAIMPMAAASSPLRTAWGLNQKFVLAYSGNLGRAHDYCTVLEAAERLRSDARVVFLMIGGGKGFDHLAEAVKARALEHSFRFLPYQEHSILPQSLSVADAHWLSLHPKLEGLIVPSKFYGIAAAGRPIVMIGDLQGELGRLVQQYHCGEVVAPGDSARLANTLRRWSKAPEAIAEMGVRARHMLDAQFTRRRALEQWSGLVEQLSVSRGNLLNIRR